MSVGKVVVLERANECGNDSDKYTIGYGISSVKFAPIDKFHRILCVARLANNSNNKKNIVGSDNAIIVWLALLLNECDCFWTKKKCVRDSEVREHKSKTYVSQAKSTVTVVNYKHDIAIVSTLVAKDSYCEYCTSYTGFNINDFSFVHANIHAFFQPLFKCKVQKPLRLAYTWIHDHIQWLP